MAAKSDIEWTDASWTPIRARRIAQPDVIATLGWHCEHVSEGCRNCYAEAMNRRLGTRRDFKPGHLGPVEAGKVELFLDEEMLTAPLRWKKPRRIFVCSMTDLFAAFVPDEWIDRIFAVMALSPQHTFQVLTKRPERMREYLMWPQRSFRIASEAISVGRHLPDGHPGWARSNWKPSPIRDCTQPAVWPLPNVWLGTSAEDQKTADERIPHLLATPSAIRFLSAEPLLGEIDLENFCDGYKFIDALRGNWEHDCDPPNIERGNARLDWVIVGGESGRNARPMHPDWARQIRDQCAAAGVPFFFKQWGEWNPVSIEEDERGDLGAAYPISGCCDPAAHKAAQECLFWQGNDLVHWPLITTSSAIGARRVGKKAAGRLLDGVEHNGMPEVPR